MTSRDIEQEVIDTARELLRRGLVEGTTPNLLAPPPDGIVVLPGTLVPVEATPRDNLVVTDLTGKVVRGSRAPTSEKALHLGALRRYPELGGVIHSHAKYCTMFAVTHQPIPCVIEEVDAFVGGDVPVADYELTGSDELGEEVARHLATRGAVLMANHGLVSVGRTIAEAMKVASLVERTAEIVWGARALGPLVPLPKSTMDRFAPIYMALRTRGQPAAKKA